MMDYSLQQAIKQRNDFLEQHPHLKEKQEEIDSVLDKCRECDRLAVVNMLMMKSMIELQKYTIKLKEMV